MITMAPASSSSGDVRMLLAIDLPELREIRNALVFSPKGSRPEPSKMAGSDLDGDEYAVTWDRRLFLNEWNNCTVKGDTATTASKRSSTMSIDFSNAKQAARALSLANADPLDYLRPPKPDTSELIDDEKLNKLLIDHFFEHNRHDVLGLIGMLWQDYAARYGAGCYKCTQLAELHSMAVDYAKTGVPAVVPRELKLSGRCPRYDAFNLYTQRRNS
jgi:RNA-dependent RNA polymerase